LPKWLIFHLVYGGKKLVSLLKLLGFFTILSVMIFQPNYDRVWARDYISQSPDNDSELYGNKAAPARRLQFRQGTRAITLKGVITKDVKNMYVVECQSGQKIKIDLVTRSPILFTLVDPSDHVIEKDITHFQGELSMKGDYKIIVSGRVTKAAYKLKVSLR
jgi:hypothetical protein